MKSSRSVRVLALAGLAMLAAALLLSVWIYGKSSEISEWEEEIEDYYYNAEEVENIQEAKEETGFFYTWNEEKGTADLDRTYFSNPVPAYSGFAAFLAVSGLGFLLFSWFLSLEVSDHRVRQRAWFGFGVVLLTLLLGAWVSHMELELTRDWNSGLRNEIIIPKYLGAGLFLFGPGTILAAIYDGQERKNIRLQKFSHYLSRTGIILLVLALVLSAVVGLATKEFYDEWEEEYQDRDRDRMADLLELKAFPSLMFPYLPYLGLACLLLALGVERVPAFSIRNKCTVLLLSGFLAVLVAIILIMIPALAYHDEAGNYLESYENYYDQYYAGEMELVSVSFSSQMPPRPWEARDAEEYQKASFYCYTGNILALSGLSLMLTGMCSQRKKQDFRAPWYLLVPVLTFFVVFCLDMKEVSLKELSYDGYLTLIHIGLILALASGVGFLFRARLPPRARWFPGSTLLALAILGILLGLRGAFDKVWAHEHSSYEHRLLEIHAMGHVAFFLLLVPLCLLLVLGLAPEAGKVQESQSLAERQDSRT